MALFESVADSSNFFSFTSLQILHGPVDLKHPLSGGSVTFRTSGTRNRGFMVTQLYTTTGEKSVIEIPFVHIERVLAFSSSTKPSLAFHLSDFAAKALATRLSTREKIEHIMRGFGDSNTAFKTLVFVLRPYKEHFFLQYGSLDELCYGGIDELCERLDVWVRLIRDKDLLAKEQRQAVKNNAAPVLTNSSNFFVQCTADQWFELLRSIHLYENCDSDADMVPYRYRPPEPRPLHAPRLRVTKFINKQHSSSSGEIDRNFDRIVSNEVGSVPPKVCERSPSRGCFSDMSSVHERSKPHEEQHISDSRTFQQCAQKQNISHIVPMQGRNFAATSSQSYAENTEQFVVKQTLEEEQWQSVHQGTTVQFQPLHSECRGSATFGSTHRTQQMVMQAQQGSTVVYQLAPANHQTSLLSQITPDGGKFDTKVLLVNQVSPGRMANVGAGPPSFSASKRPIRTSTHQKKEIETIALDDDDEACGMKATSSMGCSDGSENGLNNHCNDEPSEKRQRMDEQISDELLLVFPPGESGAVSLHFEDLRVLAHGEMLNDNIIEFYLNYIRAKLVRHENRAKVFVFNSFFYQKLTEKQPSISILNKNQRSAVSRFEWIKRNFSNIKSWTKKVDIFDMDYIVLPINDEMHWYLVIIVKPSLAVVTERTEDVDQARKRGSFRDNPDTFIVVLDSLPDPNDVKRKCVLDILRDYLECELADKRGSSCEIYIDRTRIGALYPQGVPHQENYVDCGLYLLQFAEAFLTNPPNKKMLRQGVRWKDWYPWFDHSMYFVREKITSRLRSLCNLKVWRRLEAYERQQGRGVSIETLNTIIDRARRPRRHSEACLHEINPRSRKRTLSEPPNIKKCAPPAPRMVP